MIDAIDLEHGLARKEDPRELRTIGGSEHDRLGAPVEEIVHRPDRRDLLAEVDRQTAKVLSSQ
jgi:hypothetical protein